MFAGGAEALAGGVHAAVSGGAGVVVGAGLRADLFVGADAAQRKQLAEDIQVRAYEIGAFAPMGELLRPVAFRKDAVKGVLVGATNVYWNISKP